MEYVINIKWIYALRDITLYVFASLFILSLACSSCAYAQKQNNGLDVNKYPELIYIIEKIPTTRNLFAFEQSSNATEKEQIPNIDNQDTYREMFCDKWIKKIKYLGTFKIKTKTRTRTRTKTKIQAQNKAETWVLLQSSKSMINKVKKGESISHSKLIIFDISENSFSTTKEGMSACSFQKVSY